MQDLKRPKLDFLFTSSQFNNRIYPLVFQNEGISTRSGHRTDSIFGQSDTSQKPRVSVTQSSRSNTNHLLQSKNVNWDHDSTIPYSNPSETFYQTCAFPMDRKIKKGLKQIKRPTVGRTYETEEDPYLAKLAAEQSALRSRHADSCRRAEVA